MKTFFLRDVRAASWGAVLANLLVLRKVGLPPTYPSYLSALDAIMQHNGGLIPELASPAPVAIAGQQPELTVGHVLTGAFIELNVLRPDFEDISALEDYYAAGAPTAFQQTMSAYIGRLKAVAIAG
ncbi:MAG: hypothetical protein ACRYG7_50260 [Janthinobacterium lividum]